MAEESRLLTLSVARHAGAMLTAALAPTEMPLLVRVAEDQAEYRTNGEGAQ